MVAIRRCAVWVLATLVVVGGIATISLPLQAQKADTEWRAWGGDLRGTKYSPLDQINRNTVGRLKIVWRQSSTPPEMIGPGEDAPIEYRWQTTPLMVGGMLYTITAHGTVAALDPATGKVIWFDKPVPPAAVDTPSRSLAYWTDGKDARIISVNGRYLVALNSKTGKRYPDFGENGQVDLMKQYDRPITTFSWNAGPSVIVRDVIVVGSDISDYIGDGYPARKEGRPGDVFGIDVRTGKRLWVFHTIPRPGEVGNETWENNSWSYTGSTNVWSTMSADEELGYIYVPTSTPTNDLYGGHRLGDNLFSETLVALDAKTGRRIWHFQVVHHGLWDWDLPCPPILADVTISGQKRRILALPTKQTLLFVLDRVTGQPIWPIEERPVPQTTVPGERSAPTQPIPLDARGRPFAYDQIGVRVDDLIDFTPELRAEALKILQDWAYDSNLYFPTVVRGIGTGVGKKGTVQMPADTGGTSWGGGAFDPETNILYVPSFQMPIVTWLAKPGKGGDADWVRGRHATLNGPQGLPIFKPPYGRLVAIDLSQGLVKWTIANGDGPRDHPALKGLNLPPLGNPVAASLLVTKSLVFIGEGYPRFAYYPLMGGKKFRAFDKATGAELWETELDSAITGTPMTYSWQGKQYIVATIGWPKRPAEIVALALE